MKKKRSFLLIEVLIAVLLVSICLIPLIRTPINSYRSEIEWLEEMEKERLAEWAFAEVKEKLLKNEIPWEKIPLPGAEAQPFELPQAQIQIPGCQPKSVNISCVLSCGKQKEKIGFNGEIYRMLTVSLQFDPPASNSIQFDRPASKKSAYRFHIMVRKIHPR